MECQILQDEMTNFAQWETDCHMKIQCCQMSLSEGEPAPPPPDKQIMYILTTHLINKKLEQVQSGKHLGITISLDLDWGQHISEISCKAIKTWGLLWRNLALAPRHTKTVA